MVPANRQCERLEYIQGVRRISTWLCILVGICRGIFLRGSHSIGAQRGIGPQIPANHDRVHVEADRDAQADKEKYDLRLALVPTCHPLHAVVVPGLECLSRSADISPGLAYQG